MDKYRYFNEKTVRPGSYIRHPIKDIQFIRKICNAAQDIWRHPYGYEMIKIDNDIYQYRDLEGTIVINLMSEESIKEDRKSGMKFKSESMEYRTLQDGQVSLF